jgi:hypothetical protein
VERRLFEEIGRRLEDVLTSGTPVWVPDMTPDVEFRRAESGKTILHRRTRPMPGFGSFRCASIILGGIETMHMIAKGQMKHGGKIRPSAASQFYSPAM